MILDSAQSFLLPQYGAVTILDPPASTSPEAVYHLGPSVLEAPFHLFTQHLYSLLALPQLPRTISPNPPLNPLSPPSYLIPDISPWQVDHILRMRTLENSQEARQTLSGIVRLVAKIREMKVGPLVRDRVLGAVERLEQVNPVSSAFVSQSFPSWAAKADRPRWIGHKTHSKLLSSPAMR